VRVFGKPKCDKCSVLNERLDKLLDKPKWQDFEKEYCNLETEEGLVAFCEAECVNPQRVPAMLLMRLEERADRYLPVPSARPGARDPVCRGARLFQYVGLQTDYGEEGKGVISPRMIEAILEEALG
jgi:hypothetical protein